MQPYGWLYKSICILFQTRESGFLQCSPRYYFYPLWISPLYQYRYIGIALVYRVSIVDDQLVKVYHHDQHLKNFVVEVHFVLKLIIYVERCVEQSLMISKSALEEKAHEDVNYYSYI